MVLLPTTPDSRPQTRTCELFMRRSLCDDITTALVLNHNEWPVTSLQLLDPTVQILLRECFEYLFIHLFIFVQRHQIDRFIGRGAFLYPLRKHKFTIQTQVVLNARLPPRSNKGRIVQRGFREADAAVSMLFRGIERDPHPTPNPVPFTNDRLREFHKLFQF